MTEREARDAAAAVAVKFWGEPFDIGRLQDEIAAVLISKPTENPELLHLVRELINELGAWVLYHGKGGTVPHMRATSIIADARTALEKAERHEPYTTTEQEPAQ